MKRTKRIHSYTNNERWFAEASTIGYIPRGKPPVTPYIFSPIHAVYKRHDKNVIHAEAAAKCWDVFEVPANTTIYSLPEEAEKVFFAATH